MSLENSCAKMIMPLAGPRVRPKINIPQRLRLSKARKATLWPSIRSKSQGPMARGGGVSWIMFSMILTYLRSINHTVTTRKVTVINMETRAQFGARYFHTELARGRSSVDENRFSLKVPLNYLFSQPQRKVILFSGLFRNSPTRDVN